VYPVYCFSEKINIYWNLGLVRSVQCMSYPFGHKDISTAWYASNS